MCYLEHVYHTTCRHWGKDRITAACPRSKIVQGFTLPCHDREFLGVANCVLHCQLCIRASEIVAESRRAGNANNPSQDSIYIRNVYTFSSSSSPVSISGTDSTDDASKAPKIMRDSVKPDDEPQFGFLSWSDGFFEFPGCDLDDGRKQSPPKVSTNKENKSL
jgi:hypothetical protein